MTEKPGFLSKAYNVETPEKTHAFYQDWAETYDTEILKNGYVTPQRCAMALAGFARDKAAAILDFGCGTGLSGAALKTAGFTTIDGCDISAAMLKGAAAHRDLYRELRLTDTETPCPFEPGTYQSVAATGVIATGHAPPATIDDILNILPVDGLFVFSLNDHTLSDPEFEMRIAENLDTGLARMLFKETGPHLPGIDLCSTVYVLQRA